MKRFVVTIGATFRAYAEVELTGGSEEEIRARVERELERVQREFASPFGAVFKLDSVSGDDFNLVSLEKSDSETQLQ